MNDKKIRGASLDERLLNLDDEKILVNMYEWQAMTTRLKQVDAIISRRNSNHLTESLVLCVAVMVTTVLLLSSSASFLGRYVDSLKNDSGKFGWGDHVRLVFSALTIAFCSVMAGFLSTELRNLRVGGSRAVHGSCERIFRSPRAA